MEEKEDKENKVYDYQMEGDINEKPLNELEPRSDQGQEQEVGTSPVPMDMVQGTKDTKAEGKVSSDLDKNIPESSTASLENPASETRTLKSSNSFNISQNDARPKSYKKNVPRMVSDDQREEKELMEKLKKNRKEEKRRKEKLRELEMEAVMEKKKREREDAKARTKQLKKQAQLFDVQREGKELIDKLVETRKLERTKQKEEIEFAKEAVIEKGETEREDANASQKRQNKEVQPPASETSTLKSSNSFNISQSGARPKTYKKSFPGLKQSPWERAVAQTNKGHEFLKGGKYDEAIDFYKKANMICPAENKKTLSTSRLNFVAAFMNEKLKNEEIIMEECTASLERNMKDTKVLERLSLASKHYRQMRKALDDVTWLCVLDGFSNDQSRVNVNRITKKTEKSNSTLELADRILKKAGQNKAEKDKKIRPFFGTGEMDVLLLFSSYKNIFLQH